ESVVEADRGALPGGPAAGKIFVAEVGRDPAAALEQTTLDQRRFPLARPAGLRELCGGLGEERARGVEVIELVERRGIEPPDVFVGGGERAAFFEEGQRLARAPERNQGLGLAEQPVHVVRVAREERVVLR